MSKGMTKEVIDLLKRIGAVNRRVQEPKVYENFAVSIDLKHEPYSRKLTVMNLTCAILIVLGKSTRRFGANRISYVSRLAQNTKAYQDDHFLDNVLVSIASEIKDELVTKDIISFQIT